MLLGVAASAGRIIIWIPIAIHREPGTVETTVITEENLRISMRIKDLRRPVIATTIPSGLGIIVKFPRMQAYRAQEQEGVTRAAMVVRAGMAKTMLEEPTTWLAVRHVIALMVGMVILVTRP